MSEEYRGIVERTPDIKYRMSRVVVVLVVLVLGLIALGVLGAFMAPPK